MKNPIMTYSLLKIADGAGIGPKASWSPMYSGGLAAAKKALDSDDRFVECSVYKNLRFVTTIRKNVLPYKGERNVR